MHIACLAVAHAHAKKTPVMYAPVNLPLSIEESLLKHNEATRGQKNDPCIHSLLEENTPILSQSLSDILRHSSREFIQ